MSNYPISIPLSGGNTPGPATKFEMMRSASPPAAIPGEDIVWMDSPGLLRIVRGDGSLGWVGMVYTFSAPFTVSGDGRTIGLDMTQFATANQLTSVQAQSNQNLAASWANFTVLPAGLYDAAQQKLDLTGFATTASLGGYYSKSEADARYLQSYTPSVSGPITYTPGTGKIGFDATGFVKTADLAPYATTASLSGYYTKTDADGRFALASSLTTIQPTTGYKSVDGTAGASATVSGLVFKNGLFTGGSITGLGLGSVTKVAVATANGVSGTVADDATTPTITLVLGAITPTSVNASGTVNGSNLSGTNTGDQTITLTGDVTGSGKGSFAAALANSGVTAGSYGSATQVPVIAVDAKGRVTSASLATITYPGVNSPLTVDGQGKYGIQPSSTTQAGSMSAAQAQALIDAGANVASLQASLTAIQTAVSALQARSIKGALGSKTVSLALNLLGGSQDVVIPLSNTMPDLNYLPLFGITATTGLALSSYTLAYKSKTANSITLTLSYPLVTVLSTVTIVAFGLEDV